MTDAYNQSFGSVREGLRVVIVTVVLVTNVIYTSLHFLNG